MFRPEVEKMISGFDPDQSKELKDYCSQLSTDKDPRFWDKHMEEYLCNNAVDKVWMRDFINQLKRMGFNQSKYEYSQIEKALNEFQKEDPSNYAAYSEDFAYAKEVMMKWARSLRLHPRVYESEKDLALAVPKKATHAGFSFIETGKRYKGDHLDGTLLPKFKRYIEKARKTGSLNRPILIGSRTQASLRFDSLGELLRAYKQKTRLVSIVDLIQILVECIWSERIQYQLSIVDWYAGGKDDDRINNILQRRRQMFNHFISIDYSHYDQSIPSWLIWECFDIIKACFIQEEMDDQLFRIMVNDFIHKIFIDGHGNLVVAHKGVPSGSMFTQIIDSIANRLMILSYMHAKGIPSHEFEMMIMGDDNIIFSTHEIDAEDLSNFLVRNFGVECNPDKCTKGETSEDPDFLSRQWTLYGVYRDPRILVSKLVAPERFRDYKKSEFSHVDYQGKVAIEIAILLEAYRRCFPLGMKQIISIQPYNQLYYRGDAVARSKLTTGLVKYLAEVRSHTRVMPAI